MLVSHFYIIGWLLITLSMIHLIFPSYFNWKEDLKSLSLINRQMMKIHTFFIGFGVFLLGLLCVSLGDELVNTQLGKTISLGLSAFWFCRLLIQFFGYSSTLWKGKTFETMMHILFSVFWSYLTIVFFLNYIF